MNFGILFTLPLLASGLVSALDQQASLGPAPSAFNLRAKIIGNNLDESSFNAADSGLFLRRSKPTAECDSEFNGEATFKLKGDELHLYSTGNTPHQQVYIQPSGGLGKIGYITGEQSPPANAELVGWKIDASGDLSFNNFGFIACPRPGQSWVLWINTGTLTSAVLQTCLAISARVVEDPSPNSCLYSHKTLLRLY